jgi:hypothetical protein
MKRSLFVAAGLAMTFFAGGLMMPAQATDVGVSISVGQPGFYGRIDLGNMPAPRVIYREPIIIERVPVVAYAPAPVVAPTPVYLRVPPGHAKKWRKHCHRYNACGTPVYFVQDRWYQDVYVPAYEKQSRGKGKGHGKSKKDDD